MHAFPTQAAALRRRGGVGQAELRVQAAAVDDRWDLIRAAWKQRHAFATESVYARGLPCALSRSSGAPGRFQVSRGTFGPRCVEDVALGIPIHCLQ